MISIAYQAQQQQQQLTKEASRYQWIFYEPLGHHNRDINNKSLNLQKLICMVKAKVFTRRTTLWLVRHGERIDHVVDDWQRLYSEYSSDNPPLSARGQEQADETRIRFEDVKIDHVFVSPFDRCLETAARIIKGRPLKMKVETGFIESLGYCEDPPGFEDMEILKRKYPNIDEGYIPLRNPLAWDEPKANDQACKDRVRLNLDAILDNYRFTNILIVTHNDVIAAVHDVLCGPDNWKYVGLSTVSKFVENGSLTFKCELSGDPSHLSDPTNLRI